MIGFELTFPAGPLSGRSHVPGAMDDRNNVDHVRRMTVENAIVANDDLPNQSRAILGYCGARFGEGPLVFNFLSDEEAKGLRVGFRVAGNVVDDFLEILSGPLGPDYLSH